MPPRCLRIWRGTQSHSLRIQPRTRVALFDCKHTNKQKYWRRAGSTLRHLFSCGFPTTVTHKNKLSSNHQGTHTTVCVVPYEVLYKVLHTAHPLCIKCLMCRIGTTPSCVLSSPPNVNARLFGRKPDSSPWKAGQQEGRGQGKS